MVPSLKIPLEDVTRVYQVCTSLCFVHSAFYPYLHLMVAKLDELSTIQEDTKWNIFEKMIRGCLNISFVTSKNAFKYNIQQYRMLREILLTASSWKWKNWMFTSSPRLELMFQGDQWIGKNIVYIPVKGFHKILTMYIEDRSNVDPDHSVEELLKSFNETYSTRNLSKTIIDVLKELNSSVPKVKFEIEKHDDKTIETVSEIKTIYILLEKMSWMIQDLLGILKFAFGKKWIQNDIDNIEVAVGICTKIHDQNDNSKSTSLADQYQVVAKQLIPLLMKLNSISVETMLEPRDRSTVSLDGQNILKLIVGSFRTRDITWTPSSWEDLMINMMDTNEKWSQQLGQFRTNTILDYSQMYTTLEYCIFKWTLYATELEKQYTSFRVNLFQVMLESKEKTIKINKLENELDIVLTKFVAIFKNLNLTTTYLGNEDAKARVTGSNIREQTDFYPYIYLDTPPFVSV